MADGIRIERVGRAGVPGKGAALDGGAAGVGATTFAARDIDPRRSGPGRGAKRLDFSGLSVPTCAAQARASVVGPASLMTDDERRDWALADRDAKIIIGSMLSPQVMLLLSTLWL